MRTWIMTILRMKNVAERAEAVLDRRIDRIALDVTGDTYEKAQSICAAIDCKRRLCNMTVLAHRLECALAPREMCYLKACAFGRSITDMAAEDGVSRATAFRRLKVAIKRAEKVLDGLGFDCERMERDYMSIPVCRRVYRYCAARFKEREPVFVPPTVDVPMGVAV